MPETMPTTNDANAVLMNQVAVPSYFLKMASGGWPAPRTDANARQLLQLSDMVKQAVDGYIASHENDEVSRAEQAIKAAADTALEIAGINPQATAAAHTADFLSDANVLGAASFLVDAQIKAAMEAGGMPAMASPMPSEEEEEDEEEKKKKEKAKE